MTSGRQARSASLLVQCSVPVWVPVGIGSSAQPSPHQTLTPTVSSSRDSPTTEPSSARVSRIGLMNARGSSSQPSSQAISVPARSCFTISTRGPSSAMRCA